jgi:Helix-turn-helix domain
MIMGGPVRREPSKVVQPLDTLLAVKALGVAPDLKATDRRVGTALIEHFNRKTGQCDPGLERLAGLLGLSTRTIIRSTERLEAAGLFRKTRHGGHLNRNSYEPVWSKFREINSAWSENFNRAARAPKESPAPRQSCHVQGDNAVTQTFGINLFNKTYPKRQPTEERGRGVIKGFITTRSNDAAQAAAERRWTTALNEKFVRLPVTYAEVIDQITPEMQSGATKTEMRQRGSGLAYILRQLKLPVTDPSITKEAGDLSFQTDCEGGDALNRDVLNQTPKKLD